MSEQNRDSAVGRRGFLKTATFAGAAALSAPVLAQPANDTQFAQAPARNAASAITFRTAEHLAGSSTSYAYAVKAGPFVFLPGHEGFDFQTGLAADVEGPAGYPGYGKPLLRREADYMVRRMGAILKDLGTDLTHSVRADQYYTSGDAVRSYHLTRFAEFGRYIPPSTSILMDRCFTSRTNTQVSLIAVMPSDDWKLEPFNPPEMPVPPGSGYAQAVRVNDFVFVAGNMASAIAGSGLEPTIRNPPGSQWGRPKQIRAQADWIIKKKLEPALKAAGASLSGVVKATVHLHDTANFPDFLDVWAENFHDIPCALTVAPAKGFAYDEGIIEINLIALKDGATRRKQVLQADIPPMATFGPCVRAGEFVFPSGLMPIGRDGRVIGGDQAAAFDGLVLPAQLQAATVMSYAEAACKAAGTTMANTVRAQYFTNDMKNFAGVTAAWQDRYGKHPHPFGAIQVPGPMPAPGMSLIADFWIYAG